MGQGSYIDIPNDAVVVVLGGDLSQCLVVRKRLQALGLKNIREYVRGSETLRLLQARDVDMLYLTGRPSDMDSMTFVRACRSAPIRSVASVVMLVGLDALLTPEERRYLRQYNVTVLAAAPTDEKAISMPLKQAFAARLDARSLQARLEKAKLALQKGLETTAESIYREILAESDDSIVARVGLIRATAADPADHWRQLNVLIKQDPHNFSFKFELIERCIRENRQAMAGLLLDEVLAELQQNSEVYWLNELGVLCVRLKIFVFCLKVIEHLRTVVTPDQAWLVEMLRSRTHLASGNDADAQRHLAAAERLAIGPHAEIENQRAVLARRAGRFEEAITAYNRALALAPEDHRVAYNLGLCYAQSGDADNALKSFKLALEISPDFAKAKEQLAAKKPDGKAFVD
jgi:tetratricopeptide (TPR) repeat protein